MASSGSDDRPAGGGRTGPGKKPGSGNRSGSGNRKPTPARSNNALAAPRPATAADRARERVQQQGPGRPGQKTSGAGRRPPSGRNAGGRRPQRSRSSAATAGIFGGTFVVLVAVIIILFSVLGGSGAGAGHDPYIAPFPITSKVASAIAAVPTSELAAAGNGTGVVSPVGKKGSGANIVPLTGSSLTEDGKPLFVYVGSEYCPFCAATRWALAVALSKFGTFTGLQQTASSPLDAYPSTRTLTFAKATYTSKYLAFSATEELSNHCPPADVVVNPQGGTPAYLCNNGAYYPLKVPSKSVAALVNKYDTISWFGQLDSQGAGIPFIDVGGKYIESGALYDPTLLAGASWDSIVASFKVPTAGVGQAVLASANRYIAMICEATHNKPASVCGASYVKSAEKALAPA